MENDKSFEKYSVYIHKDCLSKENESIDDALLRAINKKYQEFIHSKGHPAAILSLLKEIISDPGVLIAFENKREAEEKKRKKK